MPINETKSNYFHVRFFLGGGRYAGIGEPGIFASFTQKMVVHQRTGWVRVG